MTIQNVQEAPMNGSHIYLGKLDRLFFLASDFETEGVSPTEERVVEGDTPRE